MAGQEALQLLPAQDNASRRLLRIGMRIGEARQVGQINARRMLIIPSARRPLALSKLTSIMLSGLVLCIVSSLPFYIWPQP